MCGRYAFDAPVNFSEQFQVDKPATNLKPHFNVTPGQMMPVIIRQSPNQCVLMKWGLVPFWAKDPRIGYQMINARAETVATKPSFRRALQKQRCLVPASGFYEWKKSLSGKQPFYIKLKNERVFAFAGLFDIWHDSENHELKTFTIITTSPNPLVAEIHHRMPVILNQISESVWLDPQLTDYGELQKLLLPYPAIDMEAYEVRTPRPEGRGFFVL